MDKLCFETHRRNVASVGVISFLLSASPPFFAIEKVHCISYDMFNVFQLFNAPDLVMVILYI